MKSPFHQLTQLQPPSWELLLLLSQLLLLSYFLRQHQKLSTERENFPIKEENVELCKLQAALLEGSWRRRTAIPSYYPPHLPLHLFFRLSDHLPSSCAEVMEASKELGSPADRDEESSDLTALHLTPHHGQVRTELGHLLGFRLSSLYEMKSRSCKGC